jgi:hypothetical protein
MESAPGHQNNEALTLISKALAILKDTDNFCWSHYEQVVLLLKESVDKLAPL